MSNPNVKPCLIFHLVSAWTVINFCFIFVIVLYFCFFCGCCFCFRTGIGKTSLLERRSQDIFPFTEFLRSFSPFFFLLTFSVWKNSFSDCDAIFLRLSLKSLKSIRFLFPLSVAVATDFKLIT